MEYAHSMYAHCGRCSDVGVCERDAGSVIKWLQQGKEGK
jgi:hypothetical protein